MFFLNEIKGKRREKLLVIALRLKGTRRDFERYICV